MKLRHVAVVSVVAVFTVAWFFSCQGHLRSPEQLNPEEPISGPNRSTPRAPDSVDRGGVTLPAPSGDSQRRQFQATALAEYVFPVITGEWGSMWCVCRSVGTSPHVGQDINSASSGREVSVAISNGVVLDVTFDDSCGWSVWFEDSHRSAWRYVHLNKPNVKVGDIVTRGQALGSHSEYPRASCGAGPHLHLERRSPGVHGSPEEFRSCQYGRSSCYYNPKALIEKARILRTEREARDLVSSETKAIAAATALSMDDPARAEGAAAADAFSVLPVQAAVGASTQLAAPQTPEKRCRRALQPLFLDAARLSEIEGIPADGDVETSVSMGEADGLITLSVVPTANPLNSCLKRDCVDSWQLLFEDWAGRVQQILSVPGAGDQRLNLGAERGVCVGAELSRPARVFFLLSWSSGQVTRAEASLSPTSR